MLNKTLIKFRSDWADEFDCEQFAICDAYPDECKEKVQNVLDNASELYFGTNECFEQGELSLSDFEFIAIADQTELNVLDRLFELSPESAFGTGILRTISFWEPEE